MILAVGALGWAQNQSHPVVVKAFRHASAPPMNQVVPIAPSRRLSSTVEEEEDDRRPLMGVPRFTAPVADSVLQASALQASPNATLSSSLSSLSINPGLNILGLGTGFPGYALQANVPDTTGAVGPTQFVQWVNESFVVFNKSDGSVAYGPANGNTLWQSLGGPCSAYDNLDPIVQYDKLANRWVMMMPLFRQPSYLCVAVSTTSDFVNSTWNLYAFLEPTTSECGGCRPMPDYPKWGVWPDGYYVTYNQGGVNQVFIGAAACVVDRNSMLNGRPATMQCFTNKTGPSYGTLLPADLDGTTPPPTGSPEYFAGFDYNDQSLDVWQFHVDWTTPSNSTFTGPANIPVAPFTEACGETVTLLNYTTGACIPQGGSTVRLDSYADRLMYRLPYRNFGNHQSLVANHTVQIGSGSNQTGIRWYELQNTGSGFGLYQQGTYAPDSSYRWMGSIAMDSVGNIALGYSASSSALNPSIRYTGRLSTDPLGQMQSETDVLTAAGVSHGSQNNTFRWGDYATLAVDPTDDCTFWYTTEYVPTANTPNNHWGTRIASFSFPSCTLNTTQNYTLTANEVGQGTVTSSDGAINCINGSGACSAVYASGSLVTLNATPSSGWAFSGWSGPCSGGNPCNLVMNSNLTPTATYAVTSSWAIVNKASNSGGITNLTIPPTGTGNLIVAAILFNGGTSVTSVSDNAGNNYVSAGAKAITGNNSIEIWYAVNSRSGATVITPAFGVSPSHVEIATWEVSGISTAAPVAKNTASGTVILNNTPGPAVTTAQAGDFIVSALFAINTNFTAITSGNEFTNDFKTNGNGWAHITSNSSAAGTHQARWYTATPTGSYCASTVAFLP